MADLISRQMAIDAIYEINTSMGCCSNRYEHFGMVKMQIRAEDVIKRLPSIQSEQVAMIEEIRKWINSKNRGNADYFIVDKIEEIIDEYE